MSLRSLMRGPTTLQDAEDAERAVVEEQVRQARLEQARRSSRWTEIEADLVPRGRKGYWLVSASSDRVYTRVRGAVFQPGLATAIADFAPLYFTVDADGNLTFYERQPWTWTEQLEKQTERERRRNSRRPQPKWMDAKR
jgi:hypothetical protein